MDNVDLVYTAVTSSFGTEYTVTVRINKVDQFLFALLNHNEQ